MKPDAQRQFLDFTGTLLDQRPREASPTTGAVADAIGCTEWTMPDGCDRIRRGRAECFCRTAAQGVLAIERAKPSAEPSKAFWEGQQ